MKSFSVLKHEEQDVKKSIMIINRIFVNIASSVVLR